MASRTTSLHGFSIEASRQAPVAAISPSQQDRILGSIIKLDGRGSTSVDEEELSYSWEFLETPLGSEVSSFTELDEDGSTVTFIPDRTGPYTVGLTVSTPYRDSEQATAVVDVQSILLPYSLRTTPDGRIMFKLLSSFWKLVENSEVFSTIWSGYMQGTGADLLRLFQVDAGKSIATIQSLFKRRWIAYEPLLELDPALCVGFYGHHQSGDDAFTSSAAVAAVGAIISENELLLLDGTPSLDAVGESLEVFTGSNVGSYVINRLNSDSSGYIVSASSPFPAPTDEVLSTGTDLVTFSGSAEAYVADVAVDFSALGVVAGDVLRIKQGADSGYYRISGVGTADGLPNERSLELEEAPTVSQSNRSYTVFRAVRIFAFKAASPVTNTVYIPLDSADLDVYATETLRGSGIAESVYELIVESRHIFSAMVGQAVTITSGEDSGTGFTIAGLNESGTGYYVGSPMDSSMVGQSVSYSLPSTADISDRLLILGDRAYPILSATSDSEGVATADGGTGPVWIVTLGESTAPAGQENLEWRIAATLETTEFVDLEELGVTAGDLLLFDVVRTDLQNSARLPCTVLGSAEGRIAFDIGTQELTPGVNGSLSASQKLALGKGLRIPRVYEDPEDKDEVLVTLLAADIQSLLTSTAFSSDYFSLPLTASTKLDLESYTVRVRPVGVVRNCKIPVDAALSSVPSLFEFIAEPTYGVDEDGTLQLLGKDSELHELESEPLELIENRDYSISSDATFTGVNLETTAGSDLLRVPSGDLIDRDVRVGDYIDITSGFDQGRYIIQAVLDSETVKAVTELGVAPDTTATGLSFTLVFRTAGNFLRFVDGMFTADSPAPDRFWAQMSLYDNYEYIEDNFGVLVGVTKEQLDEYGTSQVSYRGAVQALMFAWANGPTLRNAAIGAHILMGLPVTEVAGQILQIDDDYDTENGIGRVLIEDLNPSGEGSGLVRVYYYATEDNDTMEEFSGLAVNLLTGNTFDVGDYVPAFTPLSKSILISDYISDPSWWAVGGAEGASELKKFHTWQVQVDAHEVDSRDLPLINDFCWGIRPIYTKPDIVLSLYLSDEVAVEDEIAFEADVFLSDDPVLSLESTHMVDDYNGSSLPLRVLDIGDFSTRTLFEGADLVTTAGSGTVTSVRGGFIGNLTATPLTHAPNEPVGVLPGINAFFEEDVYFRGTGHVRVGDILFIIDGENRGRFEVTAVIDDNTLEVDEMAGWPPRTFPAAEFAEGSEQVFQIQRLDTELLVEDVTDGLVDTYDPVTDTTTITSASGNFRWNGVAVNDTLVVKTGADYGLHEVLQVGEFDGFGDLVNLDDTLTIAGQLTEVAAFTFSVRRDLLRANPLATGSDGITSAGSFLFQSPGASFQLDGLQYGDELHMRTGADAGRDFTVVDVLSDTRLVVGQPFTASQASRQFRIVRPGLFERGQPVSDDWRLESLCAYDDVSLVIVEPISSVLVLADLAMAADTSDATSATDMQAAGVLPGMKLAVDNPHDNTGVYIVDSVSTTTVSIEETWGWTEAAVGGTFYQLASSWSVANTQVTLAGTFNLEFGGMTSTSTPEAGTTFTTGLNAVVGVGTSYLTTVSIGDVVRLQGDSDLSWAIVTAVVDDLNLTLDRNYTGAGGAGTLEIGVPGGMVHQGDTIELDTLGTFVILDVQGAVLTLTEDTGVFPAASYTGRVTRSP